MSFNNRTSPTTASWRDTAQGPLGPSSLDKVEVVSLDRETRVVSKENATGSDPPAYTFAFGQWTTGHGIVTLWIFALLILFVVLLIRRNNGSTITKNSRSQYKIKN